MMTTIGKKTRWLRCAEQITTLALHVGMSSIVFSEAGKRPFEPTKAQTSDIAATLWAASIPYARRPRREAIEQGQTDIQRAHTNMALK